MNRRNPDEKGSIDPGMTILDVLSKYRQTEAVFKQYDQTAGVCLCCEALFDPLFEVAKKYRIDLGELLTDLGAVVRGAS